MNDEADLEVFSLVMEVRQSAFQRMYLEACLLATPDFDAISEVLGLPVPAIEVYEDKHFPVSRFTKMRKLELIHRVESQEERTLKLWALTQGLEWVKWRLGLPVDISPVEGMQMLLPDCIYKAKQAFFESTGTVDDGEARKWTMVAMALGRQVKGWVTDKKGMLDELELALEGIDAKEVEIPSLEDVGDDPELLQDAGNISNAEALDEALSANTRVAQHPAAKAMWPEQKKEPDWDLM